MSTSKHRSPALHNAMWPGIVGKGPDSEPFIDLDTMLSLTAAAEVDGTKFDGVDLFLSLPHTGIDSTNDDLKLLAEKLAAHNLVAGSLVAPVWPLVGGGSAMGSEEERSAFLTQVRKACAIGKKLRDLGVRKYGVVRIDSAVGPASWAENPAANTKRIADTFREACTVAEGYGERLAAEGEICWGGMLQAPRFFDVAYRPVLKAVCARNADRVKGFAENWGYQSVETDWRALVARKDIDLIDIASPNDTHAEIAIAAAKAGKMVLCEKPLGRTAEEAKAMVEAVEKAKVPNMVWYNYRRVPAVVLLKKLLDEDRFGRIFHYRYQFLQDWTISQDLPQGGEGLWRLDSAVAGSGVTGDLLAHNIDMALWLNGPITEVSAMTETIVKQRKHNLTGQVEPVKIDDASAFLCRFQNGSLALFEATRYARGHKALFTLEINGERASAAWDLHDLHRLNYFDHRDEGQLRGWKSVHITDGDHRYMKNWWVPGLQIGYEHTFIHQVADFLVALDGNRTAAPTFRDGLATDYVTDAVLKSAKTKKWEAVPAA